ncbi:MAG: hypothetical protein Kow0068_07770 [Marinilabiliales bacterium]
MGKVIKLEDRKDYLELKHFAAEMLRDLHAKLDEIAINLAAMGKLKKWNDNQPEGTIICSDKMFKDLDDKNVFALLKLKEQVLKTINIIK